MATLFVALVALLGGVGALTYLGARKIMFDQLPGKTNGPHPHRFVDSLTLRSVVVAVLALLMLIPLSMVSGVVRERHGLYRIVLNDIAGTWGGQQIIKGPVLVVPYVEKHILKETVTDEKTGEETTTC